MDREPAVVVLGAGYVGLTLAIYVASQGIGVWVVDIDEGKIERLRQGEPSLFEANIGSALGHCLQAGTLHFDGSPPPSGARVWIVATPYIPTDMAPASLPEFTRCLLSIRRPTTDVPLIIVRSTVPVGYTRTKVLPVLYELFGGALDEAFYLGVCPERTMTGAAVEELRSIPQLIGGSDVSVERAADFFEGCHMPCQRLESFEAAELAKMFCNFSRTVHFNLSNFFGVCCERFGVNDKRLLQAMVAGYERARLVPPGPGVGGFCLPKDCLVLFDGLSVPEGSMFPATDLWTYPRHEYELNEAIIAFHIDRVATLVRRARRILALGLAFKGVPQTDDIRGSVGLRIVRALMERDLDVWAYDSTVAPAKLESAGLSVRLPPHNLSEYDALLLLNNDPVYREVVRAGLPPVPMGEIGIYDPWRLILGDGQRRMGATISRASLKRLLEP